MVRISLFCCIFILAGLRAQAQETSNPTFRAFDKAIPAKANKELQFLAYFYTQGVAANWFPANDFLKGMLVFRDRSQYAHKANNPTRTASRVVGKE